MKPVTPRYVIISPVKDEERYVELTLKSVTQQTAPPALWVIVDDGSSDRTPEIVANYAAKFSYIRVLHRRRGGVRQTGSAEIHAFNFGYSTLRQESYEFIVKLDCDLSFESDYFEKLLARFAENDRLGIASGVYLESETPDRWVPVVMPYYHAFGACKVIRRSCFEQIGGFPPKPGWDTVDEIRAVVRGWITRHFSDLHSRHHKREGTAMGMLNTARMHGEIFYVTGGDPLLLFLKVLRRLSIRPYGFNALALLAGYLDAVLRRQPRLVTTEEARVYRKLLRQRLFKVAAPSGSPVRSAR